jgi:hypothetical protein
MKSSKSPSPENTDWMFVMAGLLIATLVGAVVSPSPTVEFQNPAATLQAE